MQTKSKLENTSPTPKHIRALYVIQRLTNTSGEAGWEASSQLSELPTVLMFSKPQEKH